MSLKNRPYFNLREAFEHLDRKKYGNIGLEELRDFLCYYGYFATEKEICNLIMKADRTKDMRITFHEFIDEF